MSAEERKEDYKYFLNIIERKEESLTLEELLQLKHRILTSELLTESEKKSLYDGRVGILINEITEGNFKERGIKEAEVNIGRLVDEGKIDDGLRVLLTQYLTISAPEELYGSGKVFSRYAVPKITEFVEYLYEAKGRKTLGLQSLDIANLKRPDLTSFLITRSKSPSTQDSYRKILMTFRSWLIDNYPKEITVFPRVKPREEEEDLAKVIDARHGRVLTDEQINMCRTAIKTMRRPANEYYWIYVNLLLHCGLRPLHAVMLRVRDVLGAEIVRDVFDRVFYKVPFFERVKAEKKLISERVHLKRPPSALYLPEDLKTYIEEYITRNKLSEDDLLVPVAVDTIKSKITEIGERLGIKKLTSTCFRDTWVSIIYGATGFNADAVAELGGWKEKETILKHYKENVRPTEAIRLLKKYNIYLPKSYAEHVEVFSKVDVEPLSDVEQQEKLGDMYKMLREQQESNKKLLERIEAIEKGRGGD